MGIERKRDLSFPLFRDIVERARVSSAGDDEAVRFFCC